MSTNHRARAGLLLALLAPSCTKDDGVDDTGHGDGGSTADGGVDCVDADQDDACVEDDCDDSDPLAWPGAPEVCDGVDNDCDTETDEADAVDSVPMYQDEDGDDYGVDESETRMCPGPEGWAAQGGDCNDEDASIHPGATETWYDGIDSDCGEDDDDDADADGMDDAWEVENGLDPGRDDAAEDPDEDDLDNLGESLADTDPWDPDCDDDGASDGAEVASGHDPFSPGWWSGAPDLGAADLRVAGRSAGDFTGGAVAFAGDLDGDGLDDLLIGADDQGADNQGGAWVVPGAATGEVTLGHRSMLIESEEGGADLGTSVTGVGDVDGDGFHDVMVGASHWSTGDAGVVWLFRGPLAAKEGGDGAATVLQGEAWDRAGTVVAKGADMTGDGVAELLVSAPQAQTGEGWGVVYVVPATREGESRLGDEEVQVHGPGSTMHFGGTPEYTPTAMAAAGDLDGDGVEDLVVGDWSAWEDEGYVGAAWVFEGPLAGTTLADDADAMLRGEGEDAYAGWAVAAAGDMNGDGKDDLLVGACADAEMGSWAGAAYLLHGPLGGGATLEGADAKLMGHTGGDTAGFALAAGADLDDDGGLDLVVGAPGWSEGVSQGAAYVVRGPVEGKLDLEDVGLRVTGELPLDYAGWAVAFGGDANGDGLPDVLVGAPAARDSGEEAGQAYVLWGIGL